MLLKTLNDLVTSFALDEMGEESVYATTDAQWSQVARLATRAADIITQKVHLRALLKYTTINLQSGVSTYALPSDFSQQNSMYAWMEPDSTSQSGYDVISNPYEANGIQLQVSQIFSTGGWQITRTPAPTTTASVIMWYFADHPVLQNPTDPLLISGELMLKKAVQLFYESTRQWYGASVAKADYLDLYDTYIIQNNIPSPGQLLTFRDSLYMGGNTDQTGFYSGNNFTSGF